MKTNKYKVQFKNTDDDVWEDSYNVQGNFSTVAEARRATNRRGAPRRRYRILRCDVVGKSFYPSTNV